MALKDAGAIPWSWTTVFIPLFILYILLMLTCFSTVWHRELPYPVPPVEQLPNDGYDLQPRGGHYSLFHPHDLHDLDSSSDGESFDAEVELERLERQLMHDHNDLLVRNRVL